MVASFAYVPRIVGSIAVMIQTMIMDTSNFTSAHQFELSPARFFNPATASPYLLALLSRFDLMTLWVTFLLALGVVIVGKVPKNKMAAVAITFWVIGFLPALFGAYKEATG
jgi:hypothetical protein